MLCLIALITGCSKSDEPTMQTFFVNISSYYSDYPDLEKEIATPSSVFLYQDNGKDIDFGKTTNFDISLYDTDGVMFNLKYASPSTNGINTFTDIPDGKYIILAIYYPYTYVYFYSCKRIVVNGNYSFTTEELKLDKSKDLGYQPWVQ